MKMNAIERTELQTVEVSTRAGIRRCSAHRYQDFAVHRQAGSDLFNSSLWTVTHLPTGRSAARGFRNVDTACEAMIEISLLQNDWHIRADDDFAPELAAKVDEIAARHGGKVYQGADHVSRKPHLNGYAAGG